MTQAQKINNALKERVVPRLIEDGFVGKFPDYKKVCDDHIKLISFWNDKYGNAFRVVVSIIFPNEAPEHRNIAYHWMEYDGKSDLPIDEIGTEYCNRKYFMKGNFGQDFCYSDVWYDFFMENRVSDKKAKTYKKKWYEIKLQSGGDATNEKICELINKRLPKVYKWWDAEIKRKDKLKD